jgi:epoxide hydrolase 4
MEEWSGWRLAAGRWHGEPPRLDATTGQGTLARLDGQPAAGPARHRHVDVGEVTLHVVEAGTGPLVVLLHGFPEFWYSWRHQIPALAAAGLRVVAPDLRGCNLSDKPRGQAAYRVRELAADVAGLIAACGEEQAAVVGHDWGGAVAWALAIRHPERVERLVIVNSPHPLRFLAAVRQPAQLARSWYMLLFQLPWLPEALLRAGGFKALRRTLRRWGGGHLTGEDLDRYVHDLRGLVQPHLDAGRTVIL